MFVCPACVSKYLTCRYSLHHHTRVLLYVVRSVGVNKGGVAVGLKVGSTHVAFVGSHLAAHQSKTQQRNTGERKAPVQQPYRRRVRRSSQQGGRQRGTLSAYGHFVSLHL